MDWNSIRAIRVLYMTLTDFEKHILELILAGDHHVLQSLRSQLGNCCVTNREFTGCGFFTSLEVVPSESVARIGSRRLHVGGVVAKIPGLKHGAGFILFVKNGYMCTLEGYTYNEQWPASFDSYELAYESGTRDIQSLDSD